MKAFNKYGYNVYSQNGEDGILKECRVRLIGGAFKYIHDGYDMATEFGAADGKYFSNIRYLLDGSGGWNLFMIEADRDLFQKIQDDIVENRPRITAINAIVTEENINELLPDNTVILSIDIDGNDFAVWKSYNGKPDIVIIEINSSLQPDVEFFHPDRGASFCTMNRLAEEKGYFLLCHTGNCIYVLNKYRELFPEAEFAYFKNDWL